MDKGTANLREAISNRDEAEAIEREIERVRHNLDDLVNELDHRRHELNPAVLIRHHPVVVAAAGLVFLGAVAGGIALLRTRQHNAKKIYSWGARGAIPETPSFAKRVLVAGASVVAAVVVRRMARRLVRRTT